MCFTVWLSSGLLVKNRKSITDISVSMRLETFVPIPGGELRPKRPIVLHSDDVGEQVGAGSKKKTSEELVRAKRTPVSESSVGNRTVKADRETGGNPISRKCCAVTGFYQ